MPDMVCVCVACACSVDTLIMLGSPLGCFLALRGVNQAKGAGLGTPACAPLMQVRFPTPPLLSACLCVPRPAHFTIAWPGCVPGWPGMSNWHPLLHRMLH